MADPESASSVAGLLTSPLAVGTFTSLGAAAFLAWLKATDDKNEDPYIPPVGPYDFASVPSLTRPPVDAGETLTEWRGEYISAQHGAVSFFFRGARGISTTLSPEKKNFF